MNTIFSLKPKKSIRGVNVNNAMMRLKVQNALYQKELNRIKAENAALALAAQQELARQQAPAPAPAPNPIHIATHTNVSKKIKFNSLLSNMNEQRKK
jgi:hypothetical protein